MKKIIAEDVLKKLENGEALHVLDVREDEEVAQGTVPGAKHIPLGDLPARLNELEKDKHYVVICRSGGRSRNACNFLSESGYDVANMIGGMTAWDAVTKK